LVKHREKIYLLEFQMYCFSEKLALELISFFSIWAFRLMTFSDLSGDLMV